MDSERLMRRAGILGGVSNWKCFSTITIICGLGNKYFRQSREGERGSKLEMPVTLLCASNPDGVEGGDAFGKKICSSYFDVRRHGARGGGTVGYR